MAVGDTLVDAEFVGVPGVGCVELVEVIVCSVLAIFCVTLLPFPRLL